MATDGHHTADKNCPSLQEGLVRGLGLGRRTVRPH